MREYYIWKLLKSKDFSFIQELLKKNYFGDLNIIDQFTRWDLKYQLPSQFNMKIDKMTMAASLEARIPFLDKEIVNWASSIPSNIKLKGNIDKYILRLAMKDILPPEIVKRKKTGFGTPINLWLKTGFNEASEDILERLEKRNYLLRPKFVKKIRKNRHKWRFQNTAWNLLMFEIWYETFIENDGLKPIKL